MKKWINITGMCLFFIGLVWFTGCDKDPSGPQYQMEMSVFGFLKGSEFLTTDNAILVTYTQPIEKYYDLDKAGIQNAHVTLVKDNEERLILLHSTPDKPGFYFNEDELIEPGATYHLTIEIDEKVVTASTKVPQQLLQITELSSDTINYEKHTDLGYKKPIYLECEKEDQIILVDMYCNESYQLAEYIYPFHDNHEFPSDQDEYDGGIDGEPRHIQAGLMYKDLYSEEFGNQHVIFWYASMIVFYGSNTLSVYAIDDNYHNYLFKENPVYEGGITGGIGVFGSVSGQSYELNILKNNE